MSAIILIKFVNFSRTFWKFPRTFMNSSLSLRASRHFFLQWTPPTIAVIITRCLCFKLKNSSETVNRLWITIKVLSWIRDVPLFHEFSTIHDEHPRFTVKICRSWRKIYIGWKCDIGREERDIHRFTIRNHVSLNHHCVALEYVST